MTSRESRARHTRASACGAIGRSGVEAAGIRDTGAIAGRGLFRLADVKEASAKVTPLVLQAALVETAARFRLTGRTMIDLDRAGVADEVTDLMVALTYPDRFTVARERASGGGDIFAGLASMDLARR